MNFSQDKYDELVPLFAKHNNNCAKIGLETNTSPATVLKYFSIYLNKMMKESRFAKVNEEMDGSAPRCPTCGRLKNEVTSMAVCRDVFHYL